MSLPGYPEYRDSGLPWVGPVPREWNVQPLMAVASERRESNKGLEENNLLSLSYGRIVQKDMTSNDGLLPESFDTYQVVYPGDVVFRLTDLQNDKRSLRTAPVSQKGIITSAYLAVVPRLINSRYFAYLLRSYDLTKVFYSMGGGLRQSMKYSDVKRLPILVPSLQEQMAIANFLDRETARIDALIAEQEKLLALLAEKRQATISHAVTRGLDPSVPMKDSGIAWLGEVPAHWQPQKIGHAFGSIGSGTTPPSDESHWYSDGTVPWVTTGELREDVVITTSKSVTEEAIATFGALKIHPAGALVIAMYGATIGRLGVLGVPATTNQACCVLAKPKTLDVRFTFYWLHCQKQKIIDIYATGGGQPNISRESVSSLRVPAPGLVEQAQIAAHLDAACARLGQLQSLSERLISLLKERRSALISAAVTGQIDVRCLVSEGAT